MLLALGSLLLDTTVGTVVVATTAGADPAARADALWLTSPSADEVAAAADDGRPVGVTVDDLGSLHALVDAGAVALECSSPGAVDAALDLELTLWCTPDQAERGTAAGLPPERLVTERGGSCATVVGATVAGHGPEAWGEVVQAVLAGARVLRTDDVKAVRRVAAVLDRLVAARGDASPEVVA